MLKYAQPKKLAKWRQLMALVTIVYKLSDVCFPPERPQIRMRQVCDWMLSKTMHFFTAQQHGSQKPELPKTQFLEKTIQLWYL